MMLPSCASMLKKNSAAKAIVLHNTTTDSPYNARTIRFNVFILSCQRSRSRLAPWWRLLRSLLQSHGSFPSIARSTVAQASDCGSSPRASRGACESKVAPVRGSQRTGARPSARETRDCALNRAPQQSTPARAHRRLTLSALEPDRLERAPLVVYLTRLRRDRPARRASRYRLCE